MADPSRTIPPIIGSSPSRTVPPAVPVTATGNGQGDFGIRIDWVDADTVKLQPGQLTMDDGTGLTIANGSDFDITLSGDLDTGVEAADTGYYIWLYDDGTGSPAALFSISATAPTIPGSTGKRLIGWVYNDGSSNIAAFRTTLSGPCAIRFDWSDLYTNHRVVSITGAQPTVLTQINCSTLVGTTGSVVSCPVSNVLGIWVYGSSYDDFSLNFSSDGVTVNSMIAAGEGSGNTDADVMGYVPSQGPSFWWRKDGTGAGDTTVIGVQGFAFDRSGIVYG